MKETDEIWENDGHVTTQRAILFLFRDEDPTGLSPLAFFLSLWRHHFSLIRYPTIIIKQRKSMDFSYFPIRGRDIPAVKYVCVWRVNRWLLLFLFSIGDDENNGGEILHCKNAKWESLSFLAHLATFHPKWSKCTHNSDHTHTTFFCINCELGRRRKNKEEEEFPPI